MASASWLDIPPDSPFSLQNIPFGIITSPNSAERHAAIAVGNHALDLYIFVQNDGFSKLPSGQQHLSVFSESTLNAFAALGRSFHREVRTYLQSIFSSDTPYPELLKSNRELQRACLIPLNDVKNHLPMTIGDYTDFYVGLNHARNVGTLFRGADNALQPNYMHLPVGYHGRASSVVISGTSIHRPEGQILLDPKTHVPSFTASKKMDFELELGAFVCSENRLGERVPIDKASDAIFGLVLMNDWSARDIQAWEYVPLGPFTSKNLGTSISPWVVLTDALEPFLVESLERDREVLPYLREQKRENVYDIRLEVAVNGSKVTQASGRNLCFSFPQMVAHHTVTGCNLRTGDLLGSGTISGTEEGSYGSLLEASQNGKVAVRIGDNERRFLEDGDEVVFTGLCGEEGAYVGFGECRGVLLPAEADSTQKTS